MATSTSFSPSGTLADDPVSQPRSIAQPSPTEFFGHEPLDHSQPSIRLLKISQTLSTEGLIQCSISHTTIDHAPYRCLSYAWGEPEPKQLVLMNGKHFFVQPNLFEFLKVTRADTIRTTHQYWIDAVCIDQKNTAERNHQVMQMGRIYSGAETVVAWLGLASQETILAYQGQLRTELHDRSRRRAVYDDLAGNKYWTRAWITQELLLARRIVVAIGSLRFSIARLIEMVQCLGKAWARREGLDEVSALGGGDGRNVGLPLPNLLLKFRNKKCSVPRDRIFSLLSICSEKNRIEVDYGCSILELVCSILTSDKESLCVCSTVVVMQSLSSGSWDLRDDDEEDWFQVGPYLEIGIDVNSTDWAHLGEASRCPVLNLICRLALHKTDERNPPVGIGLASIGRGLVRIRISFWCLYSLYKGQGVEICRRWFFGTDGNMTQIRVGFGNWDINATETPLEESES